MRTPSPLKPQINIKVKRNLFTQFSFCCFENHNQKQIDSKVNQWKFEADNVII